MPQIPVDGSLLATSGVIGLAIAILVGAIYGGNEGMRFHRKVAQEGINHRTEFTE